jgi:CRISPR/Cas system-associated exonuclease Cas4 (RecB family)
MQFIKHCIEQIAADSSQKPDFRIIVPSQRAAYEVRKQWCAKFEPPVLVPQIFTLEQWALQNSGCRVVERVEWIYVCYNVMYEMGLTKDDFLAFYPLGKVLSYDFEDLLVNNIDFDRVYSILRDKAQVEAKFADFLSDEQIGYLQLFFEGFNANTDSKYKQRFADLYAQMATVLGRVHTYLQEQNACTTAMALAQLGKQLLVQEADTHYYMIAPLGFAPVLESGLLHLHKRSKLTILGYAPAFGTNSPVSFLRSPLSKYFRQPEWKEVFKNSSWFQDKIQFPKIFKAPASGIAGQRNMLGRLISQKFKDDPNAIIHVIIPDQKLFADVRDHIPAVVPSVSAMSYAFSETVLYDWLMQVLAIAEHRERAQDEFGVSTKQLLAFLRHPANRGVLVLQNMLAELMSNTSAIKSNSTVVQAKSEDKQVANVFQIVATEMSLIDLKKLIQHYSAEHLPHLPENIKQREEAIAKQVLEQLRDILSFVDGQMLYPVGGIKSSLGYLFFNTSVQTIGSYDAQLTLGGIESVHAFPVDTLFITGLNYGSLPSKPDLQSYIPVNVRRAFGLPTTQEISEMEAFHFYNAVFTAKEVYLLYSEGAAGGAKDEVSPLIWQLEMLSEHDANITTIKYVIPTRKVGIDPIQIDKSPEVMQEVESLFFPTDERKPRKVSPSMLSTYLQCSLKFYFAYVRGLREEALFFEPLQENELGTAYHRVMELLYTPYINTKLDAETIESLKHKVDALVQTSINETILDNADANCTTPTKGLLLIYAATLKEWVKNTLSHDRNRAPFTIKGLELNDLGVEIPLADKRKLICSGVIDRLQQDDKGYWWVVDYKTGSPSNIKVNYEEVSQLFDGQKKNDYPLQSLLYALMVYKSKKINLNEPVNARIIAVKKLSTDFTIGVKKEEVTDNSRLDELYALVQEHVNNIFNPLLPFAQTEHIQNCTICSFNTFCRRV